MKKNHTNKKNLKKLLNIISKLSCDEDTRQDILLYCLENKTNNLPKLINKLKVQSAVEANKEILQSIINDDIFEVFYNELSDDQREVMLLLESGLSIDEISEYNGIDQDRIRTLIKTIGGEYGTKKTSIR